MARTRRHCPSHKIGETVRKSPSRFRNSTAQIRITDPKQFLEMHLTHSVPADRRLAFSEWATDTMSTRRPTTRWQEIPGEIFMTSVSRPPGLKAHKVGGKRSSKRPQSQAPVTKRDLRPNLWKLGGISVTLLSQTTADVCWIFSPLPYYYDKANVPSKGTPRCGMTLAGSLPKVVGDVSYDVCRRDSPWISEL